MRVNIIVTFENVEEIDAGPYSVDLADFAAAEMGPNEVSEAVVGTIEDAARKTRGERQPRAAVKDDGPDYGMGREHPLDPEQD
jgi:hypothetical protein